MAYRSTLKSSEIEQRLKQGYYDDIIEAGIGGGVLDPDSQDISKDFVDRRIAQLLYQDATNTNIPLSPLLTLNSEGQLNESSIRQLIISNAQGIFDATQDSGIYAILIIGKDEDGYATEQLFTVYKTDFYYSGDIDIPYTLTIGGYFYNAEHGLQQFVIKLYNTYYSGWVKMPLYEPEESVALIKYSHYLEYDTDKYYPEENDFDNAILPNAQEIYDYFEFTDCYILTLFGKDARNNSANNDFWVTKTDTYYSEMDYTPIIKIEGYYYTESGLKKYEKILHNTYGGWTLSSFNESTSDENQGLQLPIVMSEKIAFGATNTETLHDNIIDIFYSDASEIYYQMTSRNIDMAKFEIKDSEMSSEGKFSKFHIILKKVISETSGGFENQFTFIAEVFIPQYRPERFDLFVIYDNYETSISEKIYDGEFKAVSQE